MKNSFIGQFCSTTSLAEKKEALKIFVQKNPVLQVKNILKSIPLLSDQHRFLIMLQSEQSKGRLKKKISFSRYLNRTKSEIKKRADKVYKRIITKERKGKRFDEIILEKLGPLIRKNDTIVIDAVLKRLLKMPEQYLLKKAYSTFMRDLEIILGIIKGVKDDGITRENVETHIFEQRDNLMKAGIRPLLKRFFFVDPAFEQVSETIVTLIRKLDQQSMDERVMAGAPDEIKKIFAKLKAVTDIKEFRDLAGTLFKASKPYIREINKLYHRLLFRPLLFCFSALRFPLDREMFRKWIEKLPLETAFSEEVRSEFFRISAEFERRYANVTVPANNEELIQLIYDSTISYTDKFKRLSSALKVFPKTIPIKDSLKKIKDIQYKYEYSFIKDLVTRLAAPSSQAEVKEYLAQKILKMKNAIIRFKKTFARLAHQLQEKQFAGRKIVFEGIIKAVNEGKKVEISLLLALDTEDGKNTGFIMKLSNFLIEYYFAIDFYKILSWIRTFFIAYFSMGGIYLSPVLSDLSKEIIYSFLCDHRKEVKLLLQRLAEYIERGQYEEKVRTTLLFDLGKEYGPAKIHKKDLVLKIRKNRDIYVISIINESNTVLFSKLYKGLNFFHQFLHVCQDKNIQEIMPLTPKEIKVLYQNAHINYVKELIVYASDRLTWLKKTEPVINLTPSVLKKEYEASSESEEWIEDFLTGAQEEKTFLFSLYYNLVKEEEGNIWKDEEVSRRISSEKNEYLTLVQHIDSIISYVKALKKICYGESIATGLKGRSRDEQHDFLISELNRIEDKDDMVGTAAFFLVTSNTEQVVNETKNIIETQGIDRYRILLSLNNVIDSHDDYQIKIRILDEFSEYLRKNQPEVYMHIKYLLDIQQVNMKKRAYANKEKVSDIWKSLGQIDSREDKIAYLDGLLADCESGLLQYYVEHIKAGFVAEGLHELIDRNSGLPPTDQYDLLCRFKKEYGESSLSPRERRELYKKELELKALCHLLTKSGEEIFTSGDFAALTKKPYSEGISLKNMKQSLTIAARKAVEQSFTKTGIPKHETNKYLDTHFKVQRSSYKKDIVINTLEDALTFLGDSDDPDELKIVSDIIDCVSRNEKTRAIDLFQKKVVVESASKREVDRLARLLTSLKQSTLVTGCPELNGAIEKQLNGMGRFIINKAKTEAGIPDDDFYEMEDSADEPDETGSLSSSIILEGNNTTGSNNSQPSLSAVSHTSGAKVQTTLKTEEKKQGIDKTRESVVQKTTQRKLRLLDKSVEARVKNLITEKGHVYVSKLIEYIRETYKPVINKYIKSLYKTKSDFYILLGTKKKYYTYKLIKSAVKKILKEDNHMKIHPELLISLEDDPGLFYVLLYELFEEHPGTDPDTNIYLPKCLD